MSTARKSPAIRDLVYRRCFLELRGNAEVAEEAGLTERRIRQIAASIRSEIHQPIPSEQQAAEIAELYHQLRQAEAANIRSGSWRTALIAMGQRQGLMARLGWFRDERIRVEHSGAVAVAVAPAVSAAEIAQAYRDLDIVPPEVEQPE